MNAVVLENVLNNKKLYVLSYFQSGDYFLENYIKKTTNIDYLFLNPQKPMQIIPDEAVIVALVRNPKDSISDFIFLQDKTLESQNDHTMDIRRQFQYYLYCYNYFDKQIDKIIKYEDIVNDVDKVVEFLCKLVNATKHSKIENAFKNFENFYFKGLLDNTFPQLSGTCLKGQKKIKVTHEDVINKISSYNLSQFDDLYNSVEKKSIKF